MRGGFMRNRLGLLVIFGIFLGMFVIPIWKVIGECFEKIQPMIKNAEDNIVRIEERRDKKN
jgi:F0F1-type ATP synthase membrane subunit b/b'